MRICYIIPSKVKFGPNLVVLDLVKLIQEREHDVKVLFFVDVVNEAVIDFVCFFEYVCVFH